MERGFNPELARAASGDKTKERLERVESKLSRRSKKLLYTFVVALGIFGQAENSWAQEKVRLFPDLESKEHITATDIQEFGAKTFPPVNFGGQPLTEAEGESAGRLIKTFGFTEIAPLLKHDLDPNRSQGKVEINYSEFEKELSPQELQWFKAWVEAVSSDPAYGKQLKKIAYSDKVVPMRPEYGSKLSNCYEWATGGGGDITFNKVPGHRLIEVINFAINHELGHLLDWNRNTLLRRSERLALFELVSNRVSDPDRFHSNYVELIKNQSSAKELEERCEEYYAEIFKAYVDKNPNLAKTDRFIIEWVINTMQKNLKQSQIENAR